MGTVSEENPAERGDELLTLSQISVRFDVSRQTLHAARQRGDFPAPESTAGSTRLRWRDSAVAAYFAANPKRPGARSDLKPPASESPDANCRGRRQNE